MTGSLFTLAYPALSAADMTMTRAFRIEHDRAKVHKVEPHFTIAFGTSGVDADGYLEHVRQIFPVVKLTKCNASLVAVLGGRPAVLDLDAIGGVGSTRRDLRQEDKYCQFSLEIDVERHATSTGGQR